MRRPRPPRGFTTVFTPNTEVLWTDPALGTFDVDYSSWQEGKRDGTTVPPTFAAVTSRSYHAGLVQVALCDGSVRAVGDSVERDVWRAVGSRNGGEVSEKF